MIDKILWDMTSFLYRFVSLACVHCHCLGWRGKGKNITLISTVMWCTCVSDVRQHYEHTMLCWHKVINFLPNLHVSARYGVPLVSLNSNIYPVSVNVVVCEISRYSGPRYNGTWLKYEFWQTKYVRYDVFFPIWCEHCHHHILRLNSREKAKGWQDFDFVLAKRHYIVIGQPSNNTESKLLHCYIR